MKVLQFFFVLGFLHCVDSLHIHWGMSHLQTSSSDLMAKVTTAIKDLTALNLTLASTINNLNPFNQENRIEKMETAINQARGTLFDLYFKTNVPLNTSAYYCQQMTPEQKTALTSALDSIEHSVANMSTLPPFNDTHPPNQQTSQEIKATLSKIR